MKKLFAMLTVVVVLLSGVLCACGEAIDEIVVLRDGQEVKELSLFEGQEIMLSVENDTDVIWKSEDTAVAVAEADGYLRAKSAGVTVITAVKGKCSASVKVTVTEYIAVESLTLKDSYTIKAGGARSLGIKIQPDNASDKSVAYSVLPDDGVITFADGKAYASKTAVPSTQYVITATNIRSRREASATMTVSEETQAVAWTIGDSIFDFNDLNDDDMVQTILKNAGYTKWHMDNIAGRTVRSASSVGVEDRINSGMYEAWSEPDLILVQCGTNDCYYMRQQPQFFTKESVVSAIENTCRYLSERYPDARVVWSTPIWRVDASQENLRYFIDELHKICPRFGVEVFDLHLTESFAGISSENYGEILPDGIHPSAVGKALYVKEFGKYLAK